ncbi:MAG TPA: SpoIIE family protein phosphatase, partial [Bacteroidia bacterium]|nr:SpoIIE family protein phosphatase [Bacteroidia bacterium]
SGSEDSMYDGMDIALCVISPVVNGMKLSFSGALRPLWIMREGSNEMEEITPTSGTIGGFTPVDQEYPTYIIHLKKGDVFYLFTDGYIDQFGGELDRKFGLRRLNEILTSVHKMPMAKQQKELELCIDNWRGNNLQLDDMLIIGVRV